MQNDDHFFSIVFYFMLTMTATVEKKMMEKFLLNLTEFLDTLSIWYISSFFILNLTLKHLVEWESINFSWKFKIIYQGVLGKFSDRAQRKRRPVSLNKLTERYNSLLISLPNIVVGEPLRSAPEDSDEQESHWFACMEECRVESLNELGAFNHRRSPKGDTL